jgi:hypothetical protein
MAGPYEPPRKGNSVLERLGGRALESPEPEESVREAFSGSRPNSEDDCMLDVRLSDGSRRALAYGTLFRVDYNPADQLKLAFAADTVVIEGRRLLPLYDLLRRHRARFVQEGTAAEDGLKPEEAAHIDTIYFENPKEDA